MSASRVIVFVVGLCLLGLTGCVYEPLDTARFDNGDHRPLRILFIGNSYSYFNGGVHRMVVDMARQRGRSIEAVICAAGGRNLPWHWRETRPRQLIAQGGWDWVVLQNYSTHSYRHTEEFLAAVRNFDREIRASGAKTALFANWGRSGNEQQYRLLAQAFDTAARQTDANRHPLRRRVAARVA